MVQRGHRGEDCRGVGGRELNDPVYAVTEHPDGRLSVATESRIYIVYPTSVSSLPLPSGALLFFQRCGEGAVAATSGGRLAIGAGTPELSDGAMAFADWNGRAVVGTQGFLAIDGRWREIPGVTVREMLPSGGQLLVLQTARAFLLNSDETVAAEVTLPRCRMAPRQWTAVS